MIINFFGFLILLGCDHLTYRDRLTVSRLPYSEIKSRALNSGWVEKNCSHQIVANDKENRFCAIKSYPKECKAFFLFKYNCPRKVNLEILTYSGQLRYSVFKMGGVPIKNDELLGDKAIAELDALFAK